MAQRSPFDGKGLHDRACERAPGGTSEVTRFRPSDNSTKVVAKLPEVIVGAGVSTCAPQN